MSNWLAIPLLLALTILAECSAGLIVKGCSTVKRGNWWRKSLGLVLVIASLTMYLAFGTIGVAIADSQSGRAMQGSVTSHSVIRVHEPTAPSDHLTALFYGYNGDGRDQLNILGPALAAHGNVVGFVPSQQGYDNREVLRAALQVIGQLKPKSITLYGESFGGMVIMDLLRLRPELHVKAVIFNATPADVSDIKLGGDALKITNELDGGPFTTAVLKANKWRELQDTPTSEPDSDEMARIQAYANMMNITGPTAIGQLRYMANFRAPMPGEFAGRADVVRYLRAPGSSDALIETKRASATIRAAFVGGSVFTDVVVPTWDAGMHAPTAERPRFLKQTLVEVSKR